MTLEEHTVIQWRKGSSIDVEVGINLDRGDLETHGLEEETSGRGNNTLADTRDDTSRDEHVLLDHCGYVERERGFVLFLWMGKEGLLRENNKQKKVCR